MRIDEEQVRIELIALAEAMPVNDVTDAAIRSGCRRRSHRRWGAAACTAVLVGAIVTLPHALGGGATQRVEIGPPTGPVTPAGQALDRSFAVAPAIGPNPPEIENYAPCQPRQVLTQATLRPTPGGVIGVVSLRAPHCTLQGAHISALLAASGDPLPVTPTTRLASSIPAAQGWPDTSLEGRADIGFAWLGSWCGRPATAIRLTLPRGSVDAHLTGPQPGCTGTSTSRLVPGVTNLPGQPTQSAPAAWQHLTAHLGVTGANTDTLLRGLRVTFTNPTGSAIPLVPIPTYTIGVHDTHGDGTDAETQRLIADRGDPEDLTVAAHSSLTIALDDLDISPDSGDFRSTTIYITFSIAGSQPATTTTHIPG
jgi:hypothetical protein